MAPKSQGKQGTPHKKTNQHGLHETVTLPAIDYGAVQKDEIEALRAIYMENFEEIHVESAWSKTTDHRFRLRIATTSDPDSAVTLTVRLTATYPKTVPILELAGLETYHERTRKRIDNVLSERPKQLLGEVMVHAIASEIEDALEDAVHAKQNGTLPSLEEERANAAEVANALAKQAAAAELRRQLEEQEEEERMLSQMVEEEISRREKRKITKAPAVMPVSSDDQAQRTITFEQPAHLTDGKDGVVFTAVAIISEQEGKTSIGRPLADTTSTSPLLAIKQYDYRSKDRAEHAQLEAILDQVRKLRHPNLVSLYASRFDKHKEMLSITLCTELVTRGTLRELLTLTGAIQTDKARQWILQLLEALEECHRHGIVHGGIADTTVVLQSSSSITTVKLCDVGYSHVLGPQCDLADKWLPQELENDSSRTILKKSDIWFLGIVVLEMCLGREVLTHTSPRNVLDKLPLSDSFEDLIERMCNKDARKRPSAFDLLAAEFLRTDSPVLLGDSRHGRTSIAGAPSPIARRSRHNSSNAVEALSRYAQDFTELGRLGKGGFGEVVKARNKLDGGVYAVKKISRAPQLDQILSEVMLLNRLNHPYVVRYFSTWVEETLQASSEETMSTSNETLSDSLRIDFGFQSTGGLDFVSSSGYPQIEFGVDSDEEDSEDGTDDVEDQQHNGRAASSSERDLSSLPLKETRSASRKVQSTLYIQMEYCERRTMRDLVRRGISEEDCWHFIRQITEGLAHIHSHGIIHRDLKPDNIFIDVAGNPKIGDFGLATTSQYQSTDRQKTFSGQTSIDMTMSVGTAMYVAPEISSGSGSSYNEKVDMYSLGIIFFEMCEPFATAMERIKSLQEIRQKDFVLSALFRSTGEKSAQGKVISCLIAHRPSDRPSSTELLRTGLLPVKIEDETIRQALSSLSDPRSPNHQKMMSALFAHVQPAENRVKALAWDARNQATFNDPLKRRTRATAKEALVSAFRLHGAEECQRESLLPRSTYYTTPNIFQVLDPSGNLLQLPYDLTLPFARQLARDRLDMRRTYTFGYVYRDVFTGGPPTQAEEVDFDIVKDPTSQSYSLDDAEVLKVLDDISIEPALMMATDNISFHLNHTVLLDAVLDQCRVPRAQFMAVKESISKLGFRQFDWTKARSELRSSVLNLPSATVDDLEQFDFRDTPDKAYSRLKELLHDSDATTSGLLEEAFTHLKDVIGLTEHFGMTRKIWIAPLSCFNAKFYGNGILLQMVHDRKTSRDVLAAGGRYDSLIQSCKAGTSSQQVQGAVGVSIGLDRLTANMLKSIKAGQRTAFTKDTSQQDSLPKRCDVLLMAASISAVRDAGLKVLSLMWASQISAEMTSKMTTIADEQQYALVVTLRHEASTTVKVRGTTDDATESDVPMVSLISHIQQELRDMQGIRRRQQGLGRQPSQATIDRKNNVQILLSQHRSKKTNKYHIVEAAQQRWSEKLEQWKDAPILAVETRDDVIDLIRDTKLGDSESWRKTIHSVQLNERQYVQQIHELLTAWRKSWLEGEQAREACLFNFRTGNGIYYDLGL